MRHDPVSLALDAALFAACADEMGLVLQRSAHSPNIKERLDFSCAVFDGAGRLVAQAAHIPVHLGSMPTAARAALALEGLGEGDTVVLNDPYAGGTHLPDITLVSPVFLGGTRPEFVVASRAHHADVGGAAPGSMPLAREIYEEGLRIPPLRLERGGRRVEEVWRLLLANVRTPHERAADLAAQLGAQRAGARRLAAFAAARGRTGVVRAAAAVMDHGERAAGAALARLPRGTFRFEDALDDDGLGNGPIRIALALRLDGSTARFDYRGSAPQTRGPVNAVLPVTLAASTYALRCAIGGELPVNDGLFRRIALDAPPGSVVNARLPAAVSAGNVETSQRIVDVALGAFARALPDRMPAASSGTMNNLLIGGFDPRRGVPFAYYETLGGGHGGGPAGPGESAMQAHMTNTRNTPVEALEHEYPFEVEWTRIRRRSGGAGRFAGGDGIHRAIRVRVPARVTVISERRVRGPYGLAGGQRGAPGENQLFDPAQPRRPRRMPGKFQIDVPAGAVLAVASPGGGGFGRPRSIRRRKRAK
ncbi:MAG TPA: hydantoinase B/oxoprolinase family protein [Candidatus Sulfotelmatobacter sp.]|nr:hydantoinase B/oxoprolinase family protein [Candidatus Sulfotelmatobacter sp.]